MTAKLISLTSPYWRPIGPANMKKYFLISLILFLAPATVSAATLSFRATPAHAGAGDVIRVDVLVQSAIPTNAFSGTVVYTGAALEPVAISDGNSIVSLWITHPAFSTASASVPFAGVVPGGFSGDAGIVFSMLFRARAAGEVNFALLNAEVLRNDGAGGTEPTAATPLTIRIGERALGGYREPPDTVPPEPFFAAAGDDPQLFGGRSYLVFSTVDKGSGVDRYEVAESRVPSFLFPLVPLSWHVAESPYVLADQTLTNTIYIRASDRAGNERLSVYPPKHLFTAYEGSALLAILLTVVLLYGRGWGRRPKKTNDIASTRV